MTPADELRAAADILRHRAKPGPIVPPLADLLDGFAEFTSRVDSEPPPGHLAGKALALARVINGGESGA